MATATQAKPELVIDDINHPDVQRALKDAGYIKKVEQEAADAELKARNEKITKRNAEVLALETEFCRDFGGRVGKRKEADGKQIPFFLRDGIHIAAMEACASADTIPDTEVRSVFRSKVDAMRQDSYDPEKVIRAADECENKLAGRCEDLFTVIKRTIADAHKNGTRSEALQPSGAEKEFNDEYKLQLKNFPGGSRMADFQGFMSPQKGGARFDTERIRRSSRDRLLAEVARGLRSRETRDALASNFFTGGALIAPEFRPYIELLRNKIVLSELGCTYMGGLMGEQVFPRQEAATVAQSVPEGAALNAYDQTLGQIKMNPHRAGSRQYYSRLMLIQAPPDFESMVWNDHANVIAIYQDEMGLNGTGAADQPIGILNQPGINQVIFGGSATLQAILNFETYIRQNNVLGRLGFVTTSVSRGRLRYIAAALLNSTVISGATNALWTMSDGDTDSEDGRLIGFRSIASQQIPNNILLAGVFEHLILGSWGGVFTVLDNYTRAANDEVAITFNTYFDVAVRHPQAFTRSLDAANQ